MAEHIVIVTVVRGRHAHLREQRRILRDVSPGTPHIIVAMDDQAIDDVVAGQPSVTVIHVERDPRGLPSRGHATSGCGQRCAPARTWWSCSTWTVCPDHVW